RGSNTVASPCPPLFSRWSTSKLNSAATSSSSSPCGSARSSFNHRQPYLGWRYSQERLAKPKTPNERLAASILQNSFAPNNSNDNEVRTSIKEVTSAIVHYVSAREQGSADKLNASSRYLHDSSSPSRSISPKGSTGKVEKCWLESSFISMFSKYLKNNSFAPNNSNDNEVRTSIKEVTSAIVHYVSAREQGSADKLNASSRYLHDSSSPS
ncbi:uncharacterized protein LOC103521070, partial [Diaphorina citri]|uniref:Uncharacterized protein LOC103521070 n=1 Tax=Diaphorina citri TaxID=121845 RepID=A0A3Q0JH70_DIACI